MFHANILFLVEYYMTFLGDLCTESCGSTLCVYLESVISIELPDRIHLGLSTEGGSHRRTTKFSVADMVCDEHCAIRS